MNFLCALVLSIFANRCLCAHPQQPLSTPPQRTRSSTETLLELHQSLVEHPSITGAEASVESYLAAYLRAHNLTVERQVVTNATAHRGARANLLAYMGSTRATRVLLTSHLDTVPPHQAYSRRGPEIWGRGSVDAKGSVAAQIHAFAALRARAEIAAGDVALLFVVGEETRGDGMRAANDLGLAWESVIFGEPSDLKLASAHKGIVEFGVTAIGQAGHSAYPERARNANAMLIPALHALSRMPLGRSERFGRTTLNIGRVEGGVAANVIAERAHAAMTVRVADGTIADLKRRLERAVRATEYGSELLVEWAGNGYEPVTLDTIEGFETVVVSYGTDVPHLRGAHRKYLYGPGDILVAHSDHEHVSVADLETAVQGYQTLIRACLGKSNARRA